MYRNQRLLGGISAFFDSRDRDALQPDALYRRQEREEKNEAKRRAVLLAIVLFPCAADTTRRHCSSGFVLCDLGRNIDFNRSIYGIQSNADPPRKADQHLLARSCTVYTESKVLFFPSKVTLVLYSFYFSPYLAIYLW